VSLACFQFVDGKDHRLHREEGPVSHPRARPREKLPQLAFELLEKNHGSGGMPGEPLTLRRRSAMGFSKKLHDTHFQPPPSAR
jgi:hypothetical protein